MISVSILNANFAQLGAACDMIDRSRADWFHLDVMDGVFVPNISFGLPVVEAVKKVARKPLDVHLMIVDPDRYVEAFHKAGADWLTVHYEACTHLHRTVQHIRSLGMKAGVVLNPHTPVSVLEDIICDLDMVLLMSVNPGFGGQKFIARTFDKVRRLKQMIVEQQSHALIEVDGGIDLSNINPLREAGVDVFVVGSFIFKAEQPEATIAALKRRP